MKKIILTIILGIFLITLASASLNSLGTFKQNDCINISQTCATCTYVNISSVSSNNDSNLISNVEMIDFGSGEWRYEFCNTSATGRHDVKGIGDVNGIDSSFAVYFEVTPTGFLLETQDSLLYIIILITTFILFLAFLYPAIKLPYANIPQADGSITKINKTKYFKLLSIWFAYGFLMWFLQTLNAISINFIKLTYLSNFITNIFTYSQWFSVGITFLILIILFIEVWKDIILSQTIKRYGKVFLDGRLQ